MYVAQTDDERKAKARKYGNEYYAKNRKRLLEKDKIRYQKNRKKKLAYQRQYRRKNQKKVKESQRKYRKSHKDELKKIHAKWRHENKESLKISKKLEYRKHRSRYKRGNQAYYQKNKENLKKSANDYHHSTKDVVRLEVLRHYSKGKPKCKCCGEKGLPFLTVDHIFGRKKSGDEKRTGRKLITTIRKKGFPPGYQILCWNCNCTKGNYGQCCHKVPWNYNKNKRTRLKHRVIKGYTNGKNYCMCCGENNIGFLTLDHVTNRKNSNIPKKYVSGAPLYYWAVRENFPPALQIYCYNCNCAKSNKGICPHKS